MQKYFLGAIDLKREWRDEERQWWGYRWVVLVWVTQESLLQGRDPFPLLSASYTCQSPKVCLFHPALHSL